MQGGAAMKQELGFKLSRQAKFWLDAGDRNGRFLWVWFVPIGDVVAVVEETWERGGQSSYEVKWWALEELEEFLDEDYCGAYSFKGYKIKRVAAVVENWTKEELKKAKKWWQIRRRLEKGEKSEELFKAFYDGIKKGYYLIPLS